MISPLHFNEWTIFPCLTFWTARKVRADNWQSVEQDEQLIAINICYSCTTMSQAPWNLITRNVQSCSLDFGYCCRRSVCTERLPSVCTGRESSMLEVAGGVTVCWSPGKQAVLLCCTLQAPALQGYNVVLSYNYSAREMLDGRDGDNWPARTGGTGRPLLTASTRHTCRWVTRH